MQRWVEALPFVDVRNHERVVIDCRNIDRIYLEGGPGWSATTDESGVFASSPDVTVRVTLAVRRVLDNTDAAPIATVGHVDNLTAELVPAILEALAGDLR